VCLPTGTQHAALLCKRSAGERSIGSASILNGVLPYLIEDRFVGFLAWQETVWKVRETDNGSGFLIQPLEYRFWEVCCPVSAMGLAPISHR